MMINKLHDLIQTPILIVDDNPDNLRVLAQQIRNAGWQVAIAKDGTTAIEQARYNPPVLILLDVLMPGIDGFETCRALKSLPETKDIPIIFMTALNDTENKVKGFSSGGVDYITKPFQWEEVLARINLHCQLHFLNQQREQQNQLLEEKVNERTTELIESLVHLKESQEQLQRSFEEVQKAKDLAESADRAKSDFLRNMSHEFCTPLNSIIGYTYLVLQEKELSSQSLESLQKIQTSGWKLLKMVRNILTLSKAKKDEIELNFESFDVKEILQNIENEFQPIAAKNNNQIEIEAEDVGPIYSDFEKVQKTVELILDNACKFTQDGRISVTLSQQERDSLSIAIEDTGIGIPPEEIPRIFLPFMQIDSSIRRKYEGTGLGLAVAQKLVRLIGGKIVVKSQMGLGSIFTVILPLDCRQAIANSVTDFTSVPD